MSPWAEIQPWPNPVAITKLCQTNLSYQERLSVQLFVLLIERTFHPVGFKLSPEQIQCFRSRAAILVVYQKALKCYGIEPAASCDRVWSGVIGRDRARPGCLEICLNGREARPSARANITWAHRFNWFPGWGWLVCASQMLSSISHDMVSFSHNHMQTAIYRHYITLEWEKYDIINIIYFVYLFI